MTVSINSLNQKIRILFCAMVVVSNGRKRKALINLKIDSKTNKKTPVNHQ